MGAKFFAKAPQGHTPNMGLQARAMSAPAYAAPRFAGSAAKDLGAAMAANNAGGLKPMKNSAGEAAKGPKKV